MCIKRKCVNYSTKKTFLDKSYSINSSLCLCSLVLLDGCPSLGLCSSVLLDGCPSLGLCSLVLLDGCPSLGLCSLVLLDGCPSLGLLNIDFARCTVFPRIHRALE